MAKKAVFVPTPGQTEQEHLARLLTARGIAYHMRQDTFDLSTALAHATGYAGFVPSASGALLDEAVSSFI